MTMLLTPGKATRRQREAIEALQAEALEKEEVIEDTEIEPTTESESQTGEEVEESEQDIES